MWWWKAGRRADEKRAQAATAARLERLETLLLIWERKMDMNFRELREAVTNLQSVSEGVKLTLETLAEKAEAAAGNEAEVTKLAADIRAVAADMGRAVEAHTDRDETGAGPVPGTETGETDTGEGDEGDDASGISGVSGSGRSVSE